jgi:hypothetical protein
MKQGKINQITILEIAALRFKTVVAEARGYQGVTLELPVESGIHGFIVLLQPPLPCIN